MDERLPYELATSIYFQGIECDTAAGILRQMLPEIFGKVRRQVKREMGRNYDPRKLRERAK